jgi:hypothetical protein
MKPIFLLLYSITSIKLQWICKSKKVPNKGDKSNLAVVIVLHGYHDDDIQ